MEAEMTNQPGLPVAAGLAAAAVGGDDEGLGADGSTDSTQSKDQGVPVGEADVQADRERASGASDSDEGGDE
jgi:hypothetical protein